MNLVHIRDGQQWNHARHIHPKGRVLCCVALYVGVSAVVCKGLPYKRITIVRIKLPPTFKKQFPINGKIVEPLLVNRVGH